MKKVMYSRMSGKLNGIRGINTSPLCNSYCQAMANKENTICQHCYSRRILVGLRKNTAPALERNTLLLASDILNVKQLPKFKKYSYGRFNAHGELVNVEHVINLFNIAKKNPDMVFGFWTKRPNLVWDAIDKVGKPDNIVLVYSSHYVNKQDDLPEGFDKVFTVYTKQFTKEHNIEINCHGKRCINCLACYNKDNGIVNINERIK